MADRKLEDHPEDLHTMRDLVAKALGAPVEPRPVTLWERPVRRWRLLSTLRGSDSRSASYSSGG